jgi:hypothetical protein
MLYYLSAFAPLCSQGREGLRWRWTGLNYTGAGSGKVGDVEQSESLSQRNIRSWQQMIAFYEKLLANPNQSWQKISPLLRLVRTLASSSHAEAFRAGQSLWHLLISTAAQYGLAEGEPFVAVTLTKDNRFQVEYWRGPEAEDVSSVCLSVPICKPVETHICPESDILSTLEPVLKRLWNDTRGKPQR